LGVVHFLQPLCRCQKQPCTNTTVRYFFRTKSGVPGRFLLCSLKRYPIRCRAERSLNSGLVSLPDTRDIIQERFFGDTISAISRRFYQTPVSKPSTKFSQNIYYPNPQPNPTHTSVWPRMRLSICGVVTVFRTLFKIPNTQSPSESH